MTPVRGGGGGVWTESSVWETQHRTESNAAGIELGRNPHRDIYQPSQNNSNNLLAYKNKEMCTQNTTTCLSKSSTGYIET